ncbi:MAG: TetR/AcrR family transcriptional regulator [Desulfobulbaceae bacterium]|nr:TetR/AcrR family transcriptional regulator [Desulfobulbaceae bacterium]HIJ79856.1 TetR/AcrR family transcriptional regulator [Deltaproteobacteria bacterium]
MNFYDNPKQNRREKILHAALKLFFKKGYFNTSVHDIRAEADVSIGLVYRYFKNKEKIAQVVYAELLQGMIDTIEQIIADNDSAHDSCRAIIAYFLEKTETFPEMTDFLFFVRHNEIMPNGTPICATKVPQIIRAMVSKGMETGEIRPMHMAVATTSIFGPTIRLIQQRLHGIIQVPLTTFTDEVWAAAWRAVKAQ